MAQEQTSLQLEDVYKLLDKINEANDKRMIAMVQEMKKPSAAEQAKLDKEEMLLARRRETRRQELLAEEAARKGQQERCPHQKKHPRSGAFISAWGGQVNSDGCWHPVCTVCGMEGPAVKAPMEWITGGVNATDPDNVWMSQLKLETLHEWQKKLGGPAPRPRMAPLAV